MNELSILQFSLARGIGDVTLRNALTYVEQRGIPWEVFVSDSASMRAFGLSVQQTDSVLHSQDAAIRLHDSLQNQNVRILSENDANYPPSLKRSLGKKTPPLLFAKGNVSLLNHPSVGFCGSRKASDKGLSIAASCANQLADVGLTIISGYAAGTDITVHKSALESGGNTVFVLPEGILRAPEKRDIRQFLTTENHVFISQFSPNAVWSVGNAMKRNSVVVGLSRAMILVESGRRGGTFAAGEESLRMGCPLFVVDYAKPEVTAEANPYFIARGGKRIRGKKGVPNVERVVEIATALPCTSKDQDYAQLGVQLSLV